MSCWMKNNSVYEEKRADQKNKTNVPLQVRSPFYVRKRSMLFHLLSGMLVQDKAWEAPGKSRNMEAASRIPDAGGCAGTAAFDFCFGLSDASGKNHDDRAEAAGRT